MKNTFVLESSLKKDLAFIKDEFLVILRNSIIIDAIHKSENNNGYGELDERHDKLGDLMQLKCGHQSEYGV